MSIRRQIIPDLENAFSNAKLGVSAARVGTAAQSAILERTDKGKFLGGSLSNAGYSTNPISAWKIGDVTYLKNGSINVKAARIGPVKFASNDIRFGKKGAVILGGYKAFRKASGRESNKVTLLLSGAMLNSLNFAYTIARNVAKIVIAVAPNQMTKAFFTNEAREWLGLSNPELDKIERDLSNDIERSLRG